MFRFVPRQAYVSVPWKNGRGMTSDVLLFPKGAAQDNCDIRVSVAPITADSPFSLFTGYDRQITLFKGTGLQLDFPARSISLSSLSPVYFDNGEPPFARLVDGPVEVFNVMTRRGKWTARVETFRHNARLQVGPDEIGVIFAAEGEWNAEASGRTHKLLNSGTAIIMQPGAVTLSANRPAAAIFARLTRSAASKNQT